jgi:hypothetical protein
MEHIATASTPQGEWARGVSRAAPLLVLLQFERDLALDVDVGHVGLLLVQQVLHLLLVHLRDATRSTLQAMLSAGSALAP